MYQRIPRSDDMTHLDGFLDGVSVEAMSAAFGAPDTGWDDIDNGYEGITWHFQGPDGVFSVYSRHGALRVGATDNPGQTFTAWVYSTLAGPRTAPASP